MRHEKMHKREPEGQAQGESSLTFATIFNSAGTASSNTVVRTDITAAPTAALTTRELTLTRTVSAGDVVSVLTLTTAIPVTNTADYASLASVESAKLASSTIASTSKTSSSAAFTSSKASDNASSSNLSTLIPAIVVPIIFILLLAFGIFWWILRRRALKELQRQPAFIMTTKSEMMPSRGDSQHSRSSSTRELVAADRLEKKEPFTIATELSKGSIELFPPTYSSTEIGVARPMTPPDKKKTWIANDASLEPSDEPKPLKKPPLSSVPNFTRPGASPRNTQSPRENTQPRNRDPNLSGSQPPGPIGVNSGRNSPYARPGPPQSGPRSGPRLGPGPGPGPRGMNGMPPNSGMMNTSGPRPGRQSPDVRRMPPPINSKLDSTNRAPPPKAINPPTPTGAFNGASPISQYSPIVKAMPGIGASAQSLSPASLGLSRPLKARSESPADENILSKENIRIARLANSSRLGFAQNPMDSPTSPDGPTLSPRLPPPVTRESPPPIGTAVSTPPADPHSLTPNASTKLTAKKPGAPRASMVSRVSTDDGYEEVVIDDAKSDVSSLDDREKWELEAEMIKRGQDLSPDTGYGPSKSSSANTSAVEGIEPKAAGGSNNSTNIRDRDSEGPFVLSRY